MTENVIALPPTPQPAIETARATVVRHGIGRLGAVLVVALAFLAASFVARNSDLWLHLATGRLLARGEYTFGTDPFAYTTEGVYWANHSWLFDLALYGLYGLVGGTGLVVLKALLVAALAMLLLSVRRPAASAWLPVVGTTLAILAMTPRLLLQPVCVSYFFLGLTLWLLWKQQAAEAAGSRQQAAGSNKTSLPAACCLLPAIPALFAVWVNVDAWFLLGPILVGLFWLGERLGNERRTPGWLVFAGLAACLVNPHTYHAFALPAELSPVTWTSGLRQDPRFQYQFAARWSEYLGAAAKLNPAALGYLALLLLGPISFVLHRAGLRSWRLTVWLPFAALALLQAWTIPFFGVVAAPITVLNLQDFAARMGEETTRHGNKETGRRQIWSSGLLVSLSPCLLVLVLLALLSLAWLGWLEGYGTDQRHVAWDVQPEPSLRQAAEVLHHWRSEGMLASGERVFAIAPEMGAYAAWFGPGERHFFDQRYPLFAGVAQDYETVCRALQPELTPARLPRERLKDWRQVLHDQQVNIVLYHDRDPQRLLGALRRLDADAEHWTLLHVAGQALIVGWNEARPADGFSPLAFDADRLAFGPQDERAQRELPAAPDQGPEQLPAQPGTWWDRWAERLPAQAPVPPAWEASAATAYLFAFNDAEVVRRERQQQWERSTLPAYAASVIGLPALPAALPQFAFQVSSSHSLLFPTDTAPQFLVRDQLGPYFSHLADRSAALPLLAVRAARRAVAANPKDANAWLQLGQAYWNLRNFTCEHSAEGLVPPLSQMRHVQIITALEQAVRLNPDLVDAHRELAALYGQRNHLDMALEHRREELRLYEKTGRRAGQTPEEYANRLEFLTTETNKLEQVVRLAREKYAAAARGLQGDRLAMADLALKLGLARQAVQEILLQTPADVLGTLGIRLELEMLLRLGRVNEVRSTLADKGLRADKHKLRHMELLPPRNPDGRAIYSVPYRWSAYEWLRLLQSAAVGDYAQAQADLRALRAELGAAREQMREQLRGFDSRVWTFLPGLLSGPNPMLPAFTAQTLERAMDERRAAELSESALRAQQADLCVLEGLLTLEQGKPSPARAVFLEAQQLGASDSKALISFVGAPIAGSYLSKLKAE
jgi:tetratricopeptide (TPR) repeat protein